MLKLLRSLRGQTEADPLAEVAAELRAEVEQLRAEVVELRQEGERLVAENAQLAAENRQLRRRVNELERSGKRQATPFARRKRQSSSKAPGRRPGKGEFQYRAQPSPDEVDKTEEVRLEGCPHCGGEVTDIEEHEHFTTDIPPVKPFITRYVTESGYCPHCQKRVRSRHEEQISEASGAAGTVVGPRAKAMAADLKHRLGLSYAKISDLMSTSFELEMTRSGWYQADQRLAEQARPVYAELVELIRRSAVVHGDETGWRIGSLSAWLWVFTNQDVTVYSIADNRSHRVIVDILGDEFEGVLVSDCFSAYDHRTLSAWLKQKCLAHLLNELSLLAAEKSRGAVRFARDVSALLRQALALQEQKSTLAPETYAERCAQLETQLDKLIDVRRRLTDPDNQRIAKRLRKHRDHLLRFLYTDGLDATNNQAERMLRPAVITRKTGGCNRSQRGAETHAILSSVLATCKQRSIPLLDFLVELQRRGYAASVFVPP
jgi:transposase